MCSSPKLQKREETDEMGIKMNTLEEKKKLSLVGMYEKLGFKILLMV